MLWIIATLAALSVWLWQPPAAELRDFKGLRRRQLTSRPQDSISGKSFSGGSRPWSLKLPVISGKSDLWEEHEEFAQCVRRLAALLRAGVPPVQAWDMLAQLGQAEAPSPRSDDSGAEGRSAQEFGAVARRVSAAMKLGLEPDRPLRKASTQPRDLWARLSWCVGLSKETGTPLSTLFEHVAADETNRADRGRALESVLAGPKTTQKLLGWLPAAGLAMAQLLGAQPLSLLLGSVWGHALLVGGCALWFLNWWWGRKLLKRVMP